MGIAKTTFIADDGSTFDTEVEMNSYEAGLKHAGSAEAYIEHSGLSLAQAGLMRKHLPAYLLWLEANPGVSAETPAQKRAKEVLANREARKQARQTAAETPAGSDTPADAAAE